MALDAAIGLMADMRMDDCPGHDRDLVRLHGHRGDRSRGGSGLWTYSQHIMMASFDGDSLVMNDTSVVVTEVNFNDCLSSAYVHTS